MTDEGEGGSAASNFWRHRCLAGLPFVPVSFGGPWLAGRGMPAGALDLRLHQLVRVLSSFDGITVEAFVAIWLGAVIVAWRSRGAAVAGLGAQANERCLPARPARGIDSPGRPGPGVELLALFARPAPQPLTPARSGERFVDPTVGGERCAAIDEHPDSERMIRLFGPLVVDGSDGRGLGQRATRGLIAYLVLQRGGGGADEILEALWPDDHVEIARPRLWNATRHVRALLGDGLRRSGTRYALDPHAVAVDAWELERLGSPGAPHASLEQALSLGCGAPLADLDYPWAEGERRRLQAVRFDLLARVGGARLEAGDPHGALACAEELLAHDPLNERGWCLAMEAEGALGSRLPIIDRYETLSRELDRQLGLRPQPQTRATFRRLLGQM